MGRQIFYFLAILIQVHGQKTSTLEKHIPSEELPYLAQLIEGQIKNEQAMKTLKNLTETVAMNMNEIDCKPSREPEKKNKTSVLDTVPPQCIPDFNNLQKCLVKVANDSTKEEKHCDRGWNQIKNSCYLQWKGESKYWEDAKVFCQNINSHLAILDDLAELQALKKILNNQDV